MSLTPQEEHTFHRLKDLLKWRTTGELPQEHQHIVCWMPDQSQPYHGYTIVGCYLPEVCCLDLSYQNPDPDGDQLIPFKQFASWRVFVPGIDTPPET